MSPNLVKYGTVNTVANFAKAHKIDLTDAMRVVSWLKGQASGWPAATQAAYERSKSWNFLAKQEAKEIAQTNWGEVYGK